MEETAYLVIRNKRYFIYGFGGVVADKQTDPLDSIISYFITNENTGEERPCKLINWGDIAKVGDNVVLLWVIKEGKTRGAYTVIHNDTTSQIAFNEGELQRLGHPVARRPTNFGNLGIPITISLIIATLATLTLLFFYPPGHPTFTLATQVIIALAILWLIVAIQFKQGEQAIAQARTELTRYLQDKGWSV